MIYKKWSKIVRKPAHLSIEIFLMCENRESNIVTTNMFVIPTLLSNGVGGQMEI